MKCNDKLVIAGCNASSTSEASTGCQNAYDGNVSTYWSTKHHKKIDWIRINFTDVFNITRVQIKQEQGENQATRFKNVSFKFSNDKTFNNTLPNIKEWHDVILPHNIESNYVTIEGLTSYFSGKSTKEIWGLEVFGCSKGNI